MAQYKLYCVGASGNSYKVALYLNCAGLDWEPVGIDFAAGETRGADWRAEFNPMGEVPVLEVEGRRAVTVRSDPDVACGHDRKVCCRQC
jgi:glutathione S-transferase